MNNDEVSQIMKFSWMADKIQNIANADELSKAIPYHEIDIMYINCPWPTRHGRRAW